MSTPLEDYGLIGDCETAALVSREGSIDWLCLPRFDSEACFAALLGDERHGHWSLRPAGQIRKIARRYRNETLVFETLFSTDEGEALLIDFMPLRSPSHDVIRLVQGLKGAVPFRMELTFRFGYGSLIPWVRRVNQDLLAIAGPESLVLRTSAPLRGEGFKTVSDFSVSAGQSIPFALTWFPSHLPSYPVLIDPVEALYSTEQWWLQWARHCAYQGPYRDAVLRSLITLKALIYAPTGGMVAAATASLPEEIGGSRNWDYRYCWLRDSTFILYSLMNAGFREEARQWRDWLLRAVAGMPAQTQIMYGLAGERHLAERILEWLPGYEGSGPVRVGNAAATQLQLDVYGEVMDSLHLSRKMNLESVEAAWALQRALVRYVESAWDKPDEGIWEIRGERRHFTHSKVMAWVAVDRGIKGIEQYGLQGPLDRWRTLRKAIHEQACRQGFNARLNSFTQSYGSEEMDASLLMLPLVGFLPPRDPRIQGTLEAIRRELMQDGLVHRYRAASSVDGIPGGEGAFLACSFWYVDNLILQGREAEARSLFERLLGLQNEVGLLSEEYDVKLGRLVGNIPQAFSHVALINSALNFSHQESSAKDRPQA